MENTDLHLPKRQNYLGGLLFLAASVFVAENALNGRFIRKSTPQSLKVGLSYFDQRKLFKELDEEVHTRQVKVEDVFGDKNQTFVLIIGSLLLISNPMN